MPSLNGGTGSASRDVLEVDVGFARLQGLNFDYTIQFYEIILGHNTKKEKVDLDLTAVGGAKDISRRHARIYYDFEHQTFALEVLGKSGCYVQQLLYLPGDCPVKLDSQDHIQIGGVEFYFLASCSSGPTDEIIAARGTPYTYSFRGVTYHVDPATGVFEYSLPSGLRYVATSAYPHSHIPLQPMSTTASSQHTPTPSQPMSTTTSAEHTPIPSQPMSATASGQHTPTPSQPMSTTASAEHTPIPSQPMAALASTQQHTPIPSQPMAATASGQHTHIPPQPMSPTACAQRTHIPSRPMNSSSMRPVHPDVSALHRNSHGNANGDNGTVIGTGTQRTLMKQNRRSFGLDLNLEPIIEELEEDAEDAHGCTNGDGEIIVVTVTQETNVEKNMSFGELDLNVEPVGTLNEDVENAHSLANGDSGIILGTKTQGTNMEPKNRSFGELDLNVVPIGALDEHENGHGFDKGGSGIIVGTGTQGTFMEQIGRSLGGLNLNVEPTGTLVEHVDKVEIRGDKDTCNPQLWQKEENDLMSSVARIVSNHPNPNGWVPAADVHAELLAHFSKIWPSSRVRKYLAPEAGSSSGAVEKPWHKLLELLRNCPEKFVICSISRGKETSDFVGFLRPAVPS